MAAARSGMIPPHQTALALSRGCAWAGATRRSPSTEGLTERRVGQIVADAPRRQQEVDDPTDHALLQLFPLEAAHAVAAGAVNAGDLAAITPLLRVLERMDRYRKAGARKAVYDDAARKRLFAKLNRLPASFAAKAGAEAKPSGEPGDATPPTKALGSRPRFVLTFTFACTLLTDNGNTDEIPSGGDLEIASEGFCFPFAAGFDFPPSALFSLRTAWESFPRPSRMSPVMSGKLRHYLIRLPNKA